MIRVLHLVSKMDRGGQETFIMNVYRNIDRAAVQFDFLCSEHSPGAYDEEIKNMGGHILYLPKVSGGNRISKYWKRIRVHSQFLIPFAKEYDIVHIHNYHALSAYCDIKTFEKGGFKKIILHSHNSFAPHPKVHKLFRNLINRNKIYKFACSKTAAEWMFGNKESKLQNVKILQNGIEPDKFRFDPDLRRRKRAELGLEDAFVVGHIGRFNYQKNHSFLLDVFAEIASQDDRARLVLVGKGELEKEITEKISELRVEDKVLFLGERKDISELLFSFDVFLFPSLFEGLSVVLIEAQAAQLPCVISDTITKEEDITTFIHRMSLDQSPKEWAKAVFAQRGIVREPDISRISNAGFDIRKCACEILSLYQTIQQGKAISS